MSRFWDRYKSWHEAEEKWDSRAQEASRSKPLKVLKTLPQMPGIEKETAKNLRWKSLRWMAAKDEGWRVTRLILRRPFTYTFRYIRSLFKKKTYIRDGDFFLYNVSSLEEIKEKLRDPKTLFVVGFSYCEKPHECPSGRFTDKCIHEDTNPVCQQCFIGKAVHSLPKERVVTLFIPTIHYIGEKMLELLHNNPRKKLLFLITACELTLEMFGNFGDMAALQGIGVRLDGRICNTMRAFELSEQGIKPGLTVVVPETERRILDLIAHFRSSSFTDKSNRKQESIRSGMSPNSV